MSESPAGDNVSDLFEEAVDNYPARVAIDTPTRTITYAELDGRANQIAAWLAHRGVTDGDRIGLALWNRAEHIELILGALKAQAIPVNINCHYTAAETSHLCRTAKLTLLLHEPELSGQVTACAPAATIAVDEQFSHQVTKFPTLRTAKERHGTDRYIIFTGGTTGSPKGVVWRQADLIEGVLKIAAAKGPAARVLPACPITHGTAQWSVLGALFSGSTIVIGQPTGLEPITLWNRIAASHTTRLIIVGDAFGVPLLEALQENEGRWDLSSLVAISSGGARWSESNRQGLLRHLPHVVMINSFGASETGGQGSETTFAGEPSEPRRGLMRFVSDGTTFVLDNDFQPMQPGTGQVGLLARTGPIPLGYLDDEVATARVFPIINAKRHAVPGDLALIEADGTIVVLGRDRNVINSGGEKVFAEEVEGRLVSHPGVANAVVIGRDDERWGARVTALVERAPNSTVGADELRKYCADTLARFKIPRTIVFVAQIEHLPNGKVDRIWAADKLAQSFTK